MVLMCFIRKPSPKKKFNYIISQIRRIFKCYMQKRKKIYIFRGNSPDYHFLC